MSLRMMFARFRSLLDPILHPSEYGRASLEAERAWNSVCRKLELTDDIDPFSHRKRPGPDR